MVSNTRGTSLTRVNHKCEYVINHREEEMKDDEELPEASVKYQGNTIKTVSS